MSLAAALEEMVETIRATVERCTLRNAVGNGLSALRLLLEGEIDTEACANAIDLMADALERADAANLRIFDGEAKLDVIADILSDASALLLLSPTRDERMVILVAVDRVNGALRALATEAAMS
jgi:hypothetical protein